MSEIDPKAVRAAIAAYHLSKGSLMGEANAMESAIRTFLTATEPQGELVEALRECQSALAMMIDPESIVKTPIRIAWAACVAA